MQITAFERTGPNTTVFLFSALKETNRCSVFSFLRHVLPGWTQSPGPGHDPRSPCGVHRGGSRHSRRHAGIRSQPLTIAHVTVSQPSLMSSYSRTLRTGCVQKIFNFVHTDRTSVSTLDITIPSVTVWEHWQQEWKSLQCERVSSLL